MRSIVFVAWPVLVLLTACSSRESTGSTDGGGGGFDAGGTDGGEVIDSGGLEAATTDADDGDAGEGTDGGGTTDAAGGDDAGEGTDGGGTTDAAGGDDAAAGDGGACGDLGKPCRSSGECGGGLECHASHVCLPPDTAICGGFAGAECPRTAPHCYECTGCDFGPCFTTEQVACVCAQPGASSRFPGCP